MGKLSQILKPSDDDTDEAAQPRADTDAAAGAQPAGDAEHPPASMPVDAATGPAPGGSEPTFASMQEYEETLGAPDALNES